MAAPLSLSVPAYRCAHPPKIVAQIANFSTGKSLHCDRFESWRSSAASPHPPRGACRRSSRNSQLCGSWLERPSFCGIEIGWRWIEVACFRRFIKEVGVSVRAGSGAGGEEMNWVEFPRLSPAGNKLMKTVAAEMDIELGALLQPSRTDPDVRSFKGELGEGSVTLRAGQDGSKIDFVLGSWLNCNLPFGALNIATLIAMLGPEADSPHLLFEFIQSGPNSLVVVLDLLPRKDLVLDSEYLARYYENSELESIRQTFEKHPQAQPYLTTALYVRSVISPTALLYKVSGDGVEGGLDKVIDELVFPAATKVFQTWLGAYKMLGQAMDSDSMAYMKKRDEQIKSKGVEVDLSANMPRLFGQDIADRVVAAFRKGE